MGFGYGLGNFGKIIGPLGLALIVGSSDVVGPKAALPAIEPAMYYLAAWCVIGGLAFLIRGIEVKGRSIEEIDAALTRSTPVKAPVEQTI
jgi:MFS transporter, putative metabolite:H+ symporter